MNLSIVIPTHQRPLEIRRLVSSIARQIIGTLQIEVIIVSNLRDKKLRNWISNLNLKFPVKYFEAGTKGVNIARNIGIANSTSEKIYFLDDDVELPDLFLLKNIFEMSDQNPDAACIGGGYELPEKVQLADEVYHFISTSWLNDSRKTFNGAAHLVGGNTLYNFKVITDNFRFNEKIIFGGSETELNLRLQSAGHKFLFNESLNVVHTTDLTSYTLAHKAIRQGMGRSLHEELVTADFWKVNSSNSAKIIERYSDKKISGLIVRYYLSLYDFFFHTGYRHGLRQNNGPFSYKVILICMLQTFFQIDSGKILFIPNPQEKPFHVRNRPGLKFRELHHWLKGNIWWKIPNYIFWKFIPDTGNSILNYLEKTTSLDASKLRKFYYRLFDRIEKRINGK